jgi:hypothetical protein
MVVQPGGGHLAVTAGSPGGREELIVDFNERSARLSFDRTPLQAITALSPELRYVTTGQPGPSGLLPFRPSRGFSLSDGAGRHIVNLVSDPARPTETPAFDATGGFLAWGGPDASVLVADLELLQSRLREIDPESSAVLENAFPVSTLASGDRP